MITLLCFFVTMIAQKYIGLGNWVWWLFSAMIALEVVSFVLRRADVLERLEREHEIEIIGKGFPPKE